MVVGARSRATGGRCNELLTLIKRHVHLRVVVYE